MTGMKSLKYLKLNVRKYLITFSTKRILKYNIELLDLHIH